MAVIDTSSNIAQVL